MANNYFNFKSFSIWQDGAAMKVCTDSCLFGAWLTQKLLNTKHLLDIGTGTGLLALMAAQKSNAHLTCIEPHEESFATALKNFDSSPWKGRFTLQQKTLRGFLADNTHKFDTIICNPPFFSNSLLSPKNHKNLSKHDYVLPLDELLNGIAKLLTETGSAFIMLSAGREEEMKLLAGNMELHITSAVSVCNTPQSPPFRQFFQIEKRTGIDTLSSEIIIRNNNNKYTEAFTALLQDFYLNL